jgi:tetratricopeptide (TPR) repeat protein
MRCIGRTKNFDRCKNYSSFLFCWHHKSQIFVYLLGVFILFIWVIALASALGLNVPLDRKINLDFREILRKSQEAVFLPYDYENFNILVADSGEFEANKNSSSYKKVILQQLSSIQTSDTLGLPIQTYYLDSFPPIKNVIDAVNLQNKHNADLILYTLSNKKESNCENDSVTYLYYISDQIKERFCSSSLPAKITAMYFDRSTNTTEFEKGRLTVKPWLFKQWIIALMYLKTNITKNPFYGLHELGNRSTLNSPESVEILFSMGQNYYNICWKEQAIDVLSQALYIDSEHVPSLLIRALAYNDLSLHEEALDDLNKIISLDSLNASAYYERGKIFYKQENIKQAINDLNNAIRLEPLNFWAYKLRKIIRTSHLTFKSEIEAYDNKIEIDSDSCFNSYSTELGVIYSLIQQYTLSVSVFDQHVKNDPNDYNALTNRGEVHRMAGDFNRAIDDIQLAISLNKRNSAAYASLAMIYADQGDLESFYKYVRKANSITPSYPFKERMYEKETLYRFVDDKRFLDMIRD